MRLLKTFLCTAICFNALNAANIDPNLIEAAKKEGVVNSVGMPDSWANWKDTWNDLSRLYSLKHSDTDMSSAQEIAKFKAEKKNATADIGDVGQSFGPIAMKEGVSEPFKTSYWDEVPQWAKDKDGHWMLAYTGTISFIINNQTVKNPPKTWSDLKNGTYKVTVGDVSVAAQAVSGVLAANYALGGDEKDLKPALNFFGDLAKQGRLAMVDPSIANLEKGEIDVAVIWDFNALNYRDKVGKDRYSVIIPQDGSIMSGYTTIINKYAKNPNAAKLAREYIFSNEGQINLAKGYARPIRSAYIDFPQDVKDKLIPESEYKNAKPIKNPQEWEKTAKKLPRLWQENVIINMK
ncbi:spermidine/putrescine ABC transporter, periplasmic substrate-binding protein [Campylobacter iguaniorum]|uniref:Spermidine/putrescine ABC transporter, periplasmic substrate-binding protein n=1 Tax=Campylobacter iguaniorum TaxID=1244531 RepID=A0A076FC32_9BACT|nr:extracellular solute-binding protein [Campylobacter iguaniorum]AII14987.1 spermidine/putrescine ABC transporter, periplasmic substrate-binding protein [Campylobacter iguaniorum]ALV24815.1 spermidine/putrescine ABC transporter, periplasmic substrate-binding protein [Campylobacter iguaniorum]